MKENRFNKDVDEFIQKEIDSVPYLEALLLLWNTRPKQWTVEEMASALYVAPAEARSILQTLTRRNLLNAGSATPERYCYASDSGKRDSLIQAVDTTYRRDLIRISRMIHSKAAPAIREFAEAFRFTKDRE